VKDTVHIATVSITAEPNAYAVWLLNSKVGCQLFAIAPSYNAAAHHAQKLVKEISGKDVEFL
jgi:hypothetical protein